jgi:hypothetical protein
MEAALAIQLLLALLDRAAAWGAVIAKAQAEGRDLTEEEVDAFADADSVAQAMQENAIAKARAEGR